MRLKKLIETCFTLERNFVSDTEELQLIKELSEKIKFIRWNTSHFDEKIQNYREASLSSVTPLLNQIVEGRLAPLMMGRTLLPPHLLELRADGRILEHIDNKDYSGRIIAGLSLKQDSKLILRDPRTLEREEIYLPRRSFYRQM